MAAVAPSPAEVILRGRVLPDIADGVETVSGGFIQLSVGTRPLSLRSTRFRKIAVFGCKPT